MTAKISKIPSNYKAAEEFDTTVGKEEWQKTKSPKSQRLYHYRTN